MNELPVDLLLYALVAAGLVFWLRSILGTRHGDERERPNPFASAPAEKPAFEGADVAPIMEIAGADQPSLPRNVAVENEASQQGLDIIAQADRAFDPARFVTAAQDAFVIIVEAYARGERDTLKNLLAEPVYRIFEGALNEREASGETVSTEIHAVRKVDIVGARLDGRDAFIKLRFTADETCVIRNREGHIVAGDPDRVTEMVDVWTFTHNIKSKDPRWLVSETSDGDVVEDHKTPMPDTSL